MQEIVKRLFEMQDLKYGDFHSKLIPNVDKERIIGIRTPEMRKLAKTLSKEAETEGFMRELPHYYYEENNLHGFLIGHMAKSPKEALDMIDEFLPYVDNWATCDCLPPKIIGRDLKLLRETVIPWLKSEEVYRVRFAIVAMLSFLLEEGFEAEDLKRLSKIKTDEYYINMAIAWYYSFALIKQYDATIGLIESKTLEKWIQNKSIQKAIESYRISAERKDYLRTLKIK